MKKPIIQISNLNLKFDINLDSENSFKGLFSSFFLKNKSKKNPNFYALKNISLDLYEGETIAIIGSNGAGKSSLLKCITKIYEDFEGSIKVTGSIGALIEIGAGFHPELTGRENLVLNCAISGLKMDEIKKITEEIINFSDIGDFIDIPVKKYSSGMFMRLAFSIATSINPDILILDESFSAGDEDFNIKANKKLNEKVSSSRLTIMISHSLEDLRKFAKRGIVLNEGQIIFDGNIEAAIKAYQSKRNLHINLNSIKSLKANVRPPILPLTTCVEFMRGIPYIIRVKNYFRYIIGHKRFKKLSDNFGSAIRTVDHKVEKIFQQTHQTINLTYCNIDNYNDAVRAPVKEIFFKKSVEEATHYILFKKGIKKIKKVQGYTFSEIYSRVLNNISLTAKSSILFDKSDKNFITHYETINNQTFSEYQFSILQKKSNQYILHTSKFPGAKLDKAISLLNSCSSNYCHAIIEMCSIVSLIKRSNYSNEIVLIDEELPDNIYKAIFLIFPSIRLVKVPRRFEIDVKNLIYFFPPYIFPFEQLVPQADTVFFSKNAFKLMIDDFKPFFNSTNFYKDKKVYIKRSSHYRCITNESEICEILKERGYIILDPSTFSMLDQIDIYSSAKLIISSSGASMANIIFGSAATRVGVLYSDNNSLDYNMWPKLASATSKAKVSILVSKANSKDAMHSDFEIIPNELVDFIKHLESS